MQFQYPKCKAILDSGDVTEGMVVAWPECGASIECHPYVRKAKLRKIKNNEGTTEPEEGLPDSIHDKIASVAGCCAGEASSRHKQKRMVDASHPVVSNQYRIFRVVGDRW